MRSTHKPTVIATIPPIMTPVERPIDAPPVNPKNPPEDSVVVVSSPAPSPEPSPSPPPPPVVPSGCAGPDVGLPAAGSEPVAAVMQ